MTLTARQSEVLETIKDMMARYRRSPTIRELGDALGISLPNGVVANLDALEAKGAIRRRDRHSGQRIPNIEVVGWCPCCGRKT